MFICKDCGAVFSEPNLTFDDPSAEGVALPSGAYVYEHCPECGGDDFEMAEECTRCGAYHLGDDLLCDDCKEELGMELHRIAGMFKLDYDNLVYAIDQYFVWDEERRKK